MKMPAPKSPEVPFDDTPATMLLLITVVPEVAFVLPLTLPATVDGWLIEPDLCQVPVATFAEPLGWTVLARPSLLIPASFILSVPSLLIPDDDTLWQPSEEFLEFMFDEPVATPTELIP